MAAYATEETGGKWRLGNDFAEQVIRCAVGERLTIAGLTDKTAGFAWYDALPLEEGQRGFQPWFGYADRTLLAHSALVTGVETRRQEEEKAVSLVVTMEDTTLNLRVRCHLWAADDLPVFRTWLEIENVGETTRRMDGVSLLWLPLTGEGASRLQTLYVENFAGHRLDKWDITDANFRLHEREVDTPGMVEMDAGGYRSTCSWLALRTSEEGAGIVTGLEYDGGARLAISGGVAAEGQPPWTLTAHPTPQPMAVPLAPGETFKVGGSFYGFFRGDWDEAVHVTHRLVEEHLALPLPDERFPYVMFNTWHYTYSITQEKADRALDIAADLGVEGFDVDLGWCRAIGDWRENEQFPDLAGLGKKIKERGMKFGLWMAFPNAALGTPVLEEHPDWPCWPDDWGSFKTRTLCMAHAPVQEWAIREILRAVDTFGVDLLKHDFEQIAACAHPEHTHPPTPSDALSVQGYHGILRAVLDARPDLIIENCQGGGRSMTFDMVKLHHTSITGDGLTLQRALLRRQAVYGASYPFPPRYCDNYMEEAPSAYACRSSMFGGPWLLMHAILDWTPEQLATCKRHIALYKDVLRPLMREGRTYHIAPPTGNDWDAIETYNPSRLTGAALVFRPDVSADSWAVRLKGLDAGQTYSVRGFDSGREWTATGEDLMRRGISLTLPERESSEILLFEAS